MIGLIVVLAIALIASVGYIIYDYSNEKSNSYEANNTEKQNNQENKLDKSDPNESNKSEASSLDKDAISVTDATSFTADEVFKVTLPKINGNTKTIQTLNKQILNEALPRTYGYVTCRQNMQSCMNKGATIDYGYVIKNQVVALDVRSTIPEDGVPVPASGGGLFEYNYFYDITSDKLLKLGEAAQKMGITDLDGAKSYDDLNNSFSYMKIENGQAKITFSEQGV